MGFAPTTKVRAVRSGAISLLIVAGGVIGLTGSAAGRARKGRCRARLVPVTTRMVAVWGKRHRAREPYVVGSVTYYLCHRPDGISLRLGQDGPFDYYGANHTLGRFVAAGTYVVAHASAGYSDFNGCAKYGFVSSCPRPVYWLAVADAKTRGSAQVRKTNYPAGRTVLSANGAFAWVEQPQANGKYLELWATPIRPNGNTLTTSPGELDSGNIDARSLRFAGATLYWTNNGVQHERAIQ